MRLTGVLLVSRPGVPGGKSWPGNSMTVRFIAWKSLTTAIFSVTHADPSTGRMIVINVPLEADPERLKDTQSLPEHLQRDVVAAARRFAAEFLRSAI